MTKQEKSMTFGSTTIGISASSDTFTIAVRTVSKSKKIHGHESRYFVFAWFVPVFASGVSHVGLLDIHIQRLTAQKGLQIGRAHV